MALSEIEKLERRYAENPQGLTFAPLAEVHRKNGDVTRALELLRLGLTLHPDYIPSSIVLGRCHFDLGELPAAETAFTHVLTLDSENVIALKALADIAERQFRFDDAERWLRTLLAVDRSNDEARAQLGRVESSHRQAAAASSASPDAALATEARESAGAGAAAEVPAVAGAGESPASASAEATEPSALGLPPLPEPPPEAVLAWVEEPGSDTADEARPLQLEELDLSEANAALPPDGIEVEQPVMLDEPVQPLSGLVGRDDQPDLHEPDDGFQVETAEDIVLESTGYSEFQVANASEELLTAGRPADHDPLMPEQAAIEKDNAEPPDSPRSNFTSFADPSLAEAASVDRWPADLVTSGPSANEGPAADISAPDTVGAAASDSAADSSGALAESPGRGADEARTSETAGTPEPATAAEAGGAARADLTESAPTLDAPAEEPAAAETASWAPFADEAPATSGAAPPVDELVAASRSWSAPMAEPPTHPEPDLVVTESMADLLLQQGHPSEALVVYRHLEQRTGDRRFHDRIAELERRAAAQAGPEPVEAAAAPAREASPSPAYSVRETGGQSVRDFLHGVLASRLPAAPPPAPRAAETSSGPSGAAPEGAPTRPAHDSLSLSSVFGEETAPTPPAVPAGNAASPQSGVSYDEFFGGSGSAGSSRPRGADTKSDDLDQFHAWLQNLKR